MREVSFIYLASLRKLLAIDDSTQTSSLVVISRVAYLSGYLVLHVLIAAIAVVSR